MKILVPIVLLLTFTVSKSVGNPAIVLRPSPSAISCDKQLSKPIKRYKLNKVTIVGADFLNRSKILQVSEIKVGTEFERKVVEKGIEKIKKEYLRFGFIKMAISFEDEFKPLAIRNYEGVVNLTIKINEGERFYIGIIEFYGNNKTRHRTLQSAAGLDLGDPYNPYKIEDWMRGLNKLGKLETVKKEDIEIEINDEKQVVFVRFHIREKEK